ncbi:MAG TPA: glycosyltransferase family 1 protein [Candidatus Saccharimonadales bacterium]|nr:glycosyltransferase family 1 protein [Candidatus Saccharimonadales bacterium]
MNIFVEAHTILKNRSGVGWYTYGLSRALQARLGDGDNLYLLTHPREPIDLGELPDHDQTIEKPIDWMPARLYHALKFRNLMPPMDLIYGNGLYLFPNFIRWPLVHSPSVIFIHDLSMFVCPEYSSPANLTFMRRHLENSVRRANVIAAVSEYSKQVLCEHFDIDPNNVVVAYPAVDHSHYRPRTADEIAAVQAKYGVFGKYMLFVSNLEPRKNVEGIIAAYRQLPAKLRAEVSLVLIGGRAWQDEPIHAAIAAARLAGDRVIQPGYVDEADLPAFYAGAELSVYPSHYEGFGIPVLESMACGTPVITADNSSLPEVGGKAVTYVPSTDTKALTHAMQELLTKPALRDKFKKAGLSQAQKFTWDKTAATLLTSLAEHGLLGS